MSEVAASVSEVPYPTSAVLDPITEASTPVGEGSFSTSESSHPTNEISAPVSEVLVSVSASVNSASEISASENEDLAPIGAIFNPINEDFDSINDLPTYASEIPASMNGILDAMSDPPLDSTNEVSEVPASPSEIANPESAVSPSVSETPEPTSTIAASSNEVTDPAESDSANQVSHSEEVSNSVDEPTHPASEIPNQMVAVANSVSDVPDSVSAVAPANLVSASKSDASDQRSDLNSVVDIYLSTLLTIGECLAESNPEVGGPYRHRLSRLRARLAFQATPETIADAAKSLEADLQEYAEASTRQVRLQGNELKREIGSFGDIIESMARRQNFYANRLRQFATQVEGTTYPNDAQHMAEVAELQASTLRHCIESMTNESASLVVRMRQEMAALDGRLASAKTLDPDTGVMNRAEMAHQIEAHIKNGGEFSLLLFELNAPAGAAIMRQAAEKLITQFRHSDRLARWGEREFIVLFQGNSELAQSRAARVVPWVGGQYNLESGDAIDVVVTARLLEREFALS